MLDQTIQLVGGSVGVVVGLGSLVVGASIWRKLGGQDEWKLSVTRELAEIKVSTTSQFTELKALIHSEREFSDAHHAAVEDKLNSHILKQGERCALCDTIVTSVNEAKLEAKEAKLDAKTAQHSVYEHGAGREAPHLYRG